MIPFDSRMPRVAFFIEPKWAFGTIHYALTKELYKLGIYADLLSWDQKWEVDEKDAIKRTYDVFCSTPYGVSILHNQWGIPLDKCVAVLHSKWDAGLFEFDGNDLKGVGSITPQILSDIRDAGVRKEVKIVRNGIHFDLFYQKPAKRLITLGYGGTFYAGFGDKNWKRSDIAKEIHQLSGLRSFFRQHHVHYTAMPHYYSKVDAVLVTSTTYEACGLPIMEAAAAGRLPITSSIGIVKDVPDAPFVVLPQERDGFIREGIKVIDTYIRDSPSFHKKCVEAQDYAREHYDWSSVIQDWADLLIS